MGQDLRDLLKREREKKFTLKEGHEERFEALLKKSFPEKRRSKFFLLKIAASMLILLSVGYFTYHQYGKDEGVKTTIVSKDPQPEEQQGISLGDLSPDLKKVENYYVANINFELAELEISQENKTLVDDFMERLEELNEAYKKLNVELNEIGPNDQTITALIKNLQLRLQLLQKLKAKLNELKSSKNEQITENSI